MFHRHGKCFGLCLFKSKRRYIELWLCMPHYSIEEHYHLKQNNIIIFLFGKAKFYKRYLLSEPEKEIKLGFHNLFKGFIIYYNCYHRFVTDRFPLIFLNIAKFWSNDP